MALDYPWYGVIQAETLEQGDFFFRCPVLEPQIAPAQDASELMSTLSDYDVLILSQSCDLVQGKLQNILLCPHWPLAILEQRDSFFRSSKGKEEIRRGNIPGYHLIAPCDLSGFLNPVRVVSFRQVFSLPFEFVRQLAQNPAPRLRLLPPYREHLAQAFARFIMRVGLPLDIPSFK